MHEKKHDLTWERWEVIAWTVILVVALFTRFYILGARVMSHDESLHTKFAWDLYAGRGYQHNPMMHGPLLLHLAALSYFLFGVNDFAARFFPALAGVALVLTPILFRRFMGRKGAVATGLLLLLSPSITYYSRYIRHDVYNMLAAVLLLWAGLAYIEGRDRRYLGTYAAAFAFLFTTKETAYIYLAIFFALAGALYLAQVLRAEGEWASPRLLRGFYAVILLIIVLMMVLVLAQHQAQVQTYNLDAAGNTRAAEAVLPWWGHVATYAMLVAAMGAVALLYLGAGETLLRRFPLFDLLLLGGTFLLPLGSAFFIRMARVDMLKLATSLTQGDLKVLLSPDTFVATLIVLLTLLASAAIGLWWDGERWPKLAAIYYTIFTLFYTTFFTNPLGFVSGLVGSLAYWMAQQGVERGGQPLYYYFIVAPLYEYLIIALTVGGGIAAFFHLKRERDEARPWKRWLPLFLLGWAVMAWLAYTLAGEKMPWLTVHLALPGAFLGGWWLGSVAERMRMRDRGAAAWLALSLPLWAMGAWLTLTYLPPSLQALRRGAGPTGYTLAELEAFGRALSGLGILTLFTFVARRSARRLGADTERLLLGVAVLLLALLTVRTSVMLNYINYDLAKEFLVYAHGAPDAKVALSQIEEVSWRLTGAPHDVAVAYGEDGSWPMSWYIDPHYPNRYYYGTAPDSQQLLNCPVILAGYPQWNVVDAIVGEDYIHFDYTYLWWPIEDYKGLTWARIEVALKNPAMRHALWQIIWWRDYREYAALTGKEITLKRWPYRKDFRLYVRRDVAERVWSYHLGPEGGSTEATQPETAVPDPYAGWAQTLPVAGRLTLTGGHPRDLAVAADGSIYAADTLAHRIWHVGAQGNVLALWGGQGSEPKAFNEPWGLALDDEGRLYVADTWNHRVQVFDAQGNVLRSWGSYGETGLGGAGASFFGPRDVAVGADGRIYVADTGNKRIQVFDEEGNFLFDFGGGGSAPGQLNEPVGLAFDAEGMLWVADSWNLRVQRFDAAGHFVQMWPVATWDVQNPFDKPFLATDEAGTLYVTDLSHRRVLAFREDGGLLWTLGPDYGGGAFTSVGGVAVRDGKLYVSDPDAGQIVVFALEKP